MSECQIIPVRTCVVCGKMRVDRSGDRSLLVPRGGVKVTTCYPCAYWVNGVRVPATFTPDPNGAA